MSSTAEPKVAYYCMEYGLSSDLTIYSGGLGILAGDLMKSVGDLGAPVTGIGLFWDRGYTRQTVGEDGKPIDRYECTDRSVLSDTGARAVVEVRGKSVEIMAHRVTDYTTAELLLIEPVNEDDRWITKSLYGGSNQDRVAQEILLGVGGVRILDALGIEVDVHHFNEGHAVFAGLELVRRRCEQGVEFDDAIADVKQQVVFTTHTPVPAGNEVHEISTLVEQGAALGFSEQQLESLGGRPFGMTVAGLRLSRRASAVAELHGETAREMWSGVQGGGEILSITNGVHVGTWQDERIRSAAGQAQGLLEAREELRAELRADIKARTGVEFSREDLVVGFARRAATYKRADLILGDAERLQGLLSKGVRLVFAGKAHPADEAGKAVVSRVVAAAREFSQQIVFLQDYDMELGALLTRGCDVWLNNPRRPQEACGTSGMKAAMNGVLNCSILDGWWAEACEHGKNGWKIEARNGADSDSARDQADRAALYAVLTNEVCASWVDKPRWTEMMNASIAMANPQFSSDRMLQQYYRELYRA